MENIILIIEDLFSTTFKIILFYRIIKWQGFLFGFPFFILLFSCYRIIISKIFKLIPLTPLDICFYSNNNSNRFNIISILEINNFNYEIIKNTFINKSIKNIKKLRLKLIYKFYNYYWKEFDIENIIKNVFIYKEIPHNNFNTYINQEINSFIDVNKHFPYEIHCIKFTNPNNNNKGAILFKFDHLMSDGLSMISLICSLDRNYSLDLFPSLMKSSQPLSTFKNLLIWISFPFLGPYSLYLLFFTHCNLTPFREKINNNINNNFSLSFGKFHLLQKFNEKRKKINVSFNQAFMSIISNSVYKICIDVYKDNANKCNGIKCMMPIGRKKIQTNYKKIILNNTTNFIFTKLNLITNINNISEIQQNSITLKNEINNYLLNNTYLNWAKVLGRFISFRIINFFANLYCRNVDLVVSNVPGPVKKIFIGNDDTYCEIDKIYACCSPGREIPFIIVMSYNNEFVTSVTISKKYNVDEKKFIMFIDEGIEEFINNENY